MTPTWLNAWLAKPGLTFAEHYAEQLDEKLRARRARREQRQAAARKGWATRRGQA